MEQAIEQYPLQQAYAALHEHGLGGAGVALRILVDEAGKIERSQFLGVRPYERGEGRAGRANGFKPKTVTTRLGELTFAVPQVRSGGFYPSALEKGSRLYPEIIYAPPNMKSSNRASPLVFSKENPSRNMSTQCIKRSRNASGT
jgi:hypothetical protein